MKKEEFNRLVDRINSKEISEEEFRNLIESGELTSEDWESIEGSVDHDALSEILSSDSERSSESASEQEKKTQNRKDRKGILIIIFALFIAAAIILFPSDFSEKPSGPVELSSKTVPNIEEIPTPSPVGEEVGILTRGIPEIRNFVRKVNPLWMILEGCFLREANIIIWATMILFLGGLWGDARFRRQWIDAYVVIGAILATFVIYVVPNKTSDLALALMVGSIVGIVVTSVHGGVDFTPLSSYFGIVASIGYIFGRIGVYSVYFDLPVETMVLIFISLSVVFSILDGVLNGHRPTIYVGLTFVAVYIVFSSFLVRQFFAFLLKERIGALLWENKLIVATSMIFTITFMLMYISVRLLKNPTWFGESYDKVVSVGQGRGFSIVTAFDTWIVAASFLGGITYCLDYFI